VKNAAVHSIATATFTLDSWDETPWDNGVGATLSRARVAKTFHGEIEGTSVAELLLAQAHDTASRAYVGFERITASINGRLGSFVLHHTATASGFGHAVSWSIVPDTGTGGLERISGEAQIIQTSNGGHEITLDYELEL
jgi:hypothetical protein